MSLKKIWMYVGIAPVLVLGLATPLLSSGCSGSDSCSADISVRFDQLKAAAEGLTTASLALKGEVGLACANIATGLNQTGVPNHTDWSTAPDDDITSACNLANAALDLEFNAGAQISIAITGGECHVDAQVQFDCEAKCSVDGSCQPGSIEARCTPGDLSVECSGECQANATCEGSASVEAQCSGTCEGNCTGTCATGEPSGSHCTGRCEGTCSGDCKLAADAHINCGANVRCKGGCSVSGTAPQCEATITPPSCNLDADCEAGCQGQANFDAVCTPPSVDVVVTGGASANLQTVLTTNLPAIFDGFMFKGQLVFSAAGDVAASFGKAVEALVTVPACVLSYGSDFAASVTGAASASVSVNVSFQASGSVGGKAGG